MMRIPFHRRLEVLSVSALVFLLLQTSVMGKQLTAGERNAIVKPTIATDASVQVKRGGDVEITLKAVPSYGNMESFLIQTPPAHGSLTDPKNSSDHTATVIYHHDGTKEPLADGFSFRVKAPGQALSVPANVAIRIIPPPPKLVFKPEVVDFGTVFLGGKRRTNVLLSNIGGGRAVGRLLLQGRFSLPNGDKYQLDEGESLSVPVEFSPMEPRKYEERLIPTPSAQGASLLLRGEGTPRFEATSVDAGGGAGVTWRLRNLSDQVLRISFLSEVGLKGGTVGGWILPPETEIPPASESTVTLKQQDAEGIASESHTSFKQSMVRISDGLSEGVMELPAPRRFIPVTVRLNPAPGNLPLGGALSLSFTLMNRSDMPKHVTWKITSALGGGMEQPAAVDLRGGESKEIQYPWAPSVPGQDVVRLAVDEGGKLQGDLLWKLGVTRELPAVAPRVNPEPVPPEPAIPEMQESAVPASSLPVAVNSIPPVEGVKAEVEIPWIGNPKVLISWSVGADGGAVPSSFRIQESLLIPNQNTAVPRIPSAPVSLLGKEGLPSMSLKLVDLPSISVKGGNAQVKAVIRGMRPGSHLIIISRVANDGIIKERSQIGVFVPNPKTCWDALKLPLGMAAVALLILFLSRIGRG